MSYRVVVSSQPNDSDGGYATPAAMVLSLALALVASASIIRSVTLLRLAKSDLEQARIEYALSGAQLQAAAQIIRTGQSGPFHWTSSTDLGFVDVLVERESSKLSLAAGSQLAPNVFVSFGVADPALLQAKLAASAAASDSVVDVAGMDSSPIWRVCGSRLVSSYGQQNAFAFVPDVQPVAGDKPAWWRIGEVWRIRVATAAGWRDDKIVRFTGDASHPIAVVARWFSRGAGDGGRCEELLKGASAG